MPEQQDNPQTTKADDLTGLRCPKCDYELTGLLQTKCPECGETFDAATLRAARLKKFRVHTQYAMLIAIFALGNLCIQVVVIVLISNQRALMNVVPIVAEHLDRIAWVGMNAAVLGGGASVILAMITFIAAGTRSNGTAMVVAALAILLSLFAAYLGLDNVLVTYW